MMCRLFILVASLVGVAFGGSAPAFIWGSSCPQRPSLQTLSQDEFADILEPFLKDSMIVAFLEPGLSNSDFACTKVKTDDSCYSNLKGVTPKTYYGRVENATEALRQISANREFADLNLDGELETDISYEQGKVVFVSFVPPTDYIESSNLLELHDVAISKVYTKLSEEGRITGVYTRTQSTDIGIARHRRATKLRPGNIFRLRNFFMLHYSTLTLLEGVNEIKNTTIEIMFAFVIGQNDTPTVFLETNYLKSNMSFRVEHMGGYFEMRSFQFNEDNFYILPPVSSPTSFSYYCGTQRFYSWSGDRVIIWREFQLQLPYNENYEANFTFDHPWHCVGFFTPGILAGLFVVIILLGIVALGICWMMDINTMDRFDDPKGKTITINVNA